MTIDIIKIIFLISLAIIVGIGYPFAAIWALNTLFSLDIGYTFWNWLAIVVVHIFFQGNAIITNTNK